ncbi:MAG: DASS family sodium-coupled anion symporter [Planctomycetota bacterium]|jgi:DASS family divalent anion:Na+ symporter
MIQEREGRIRPIRAAVIMLAALLAWLLIPMPEGLDFRAWSLAFIFLATIVVIASSAMPIFVASIAALTLAVSTHVLTPEQAFAGFSNPLILLIAVAFLVARSVVKSGLGERIAYLIISRLGGTTLGLGYSMVATDMLIAPAFPSNTARSAVLFPITQSLAQGTGSRADDASRRKTGAFLMMISMAGLSISSGLWLTAMAANPAGAAMAAEYGVEISFGSWLLAASLPSILAFLCIPYVVYRVLAPEVKRAPEVKELARERLREMGSPRRREWIVAATFLCLVSLWSMSGWLGIDITSVAFAGLFVLMVTGIFSLEDLRAEGSALEVLVWFAILYTISTSLNELGFMSFLGTKVAEMMAGYPWPLAYALLLGSYVVLHYFFVSQTAHLLALFPVYLALSAAVGVPLVLMAYMLLFATNFFSCITPQGSSANVIFVGSGYLRASEVYRVGGIVTLANLLVYGLVGTLWILLVM